MFWKTNRGNLWLALSGDSNDCKKIWQIFNYLVMKSHLKVHFQSSSKKSLLKLPEGALISLSRSTARTQLPITVRDAPFAVPQIITKRLTSDLLELVLPMRFLINEHPSGLMITMGVAKRFAKFKWPSRLWSCRSFIKLRFINISSVFVRLSIFPSSNDIVFAIFHRIPRYSKSCVGVNTDFW